MKKILLYTPIFDFIVEDIINKINDIPVGVKFNFEMNSPGGSVFAGWGLINALKERENDINSFLVTGHAASMSFIIALFFDNVTALDVASFMVHRAFGRAENEDQQKLLDEVNSQIRLKMEKKFDAKIFETVTGTTIADLFEAEDRKDLWITAKQAKQIGLISDIKRIEPKEHLKLVAMLEENQIHGSIDAQGSAIDLMAVRDFINNFTL